MKYILYMFYLNYFKVAKKKKQQQKSKNFPIITCIIGVKPVNILTMLTVK